MVRTEQTEQTEPTDRFETNFFIFFFTKERTKIWTTTVYRFLISDLISELQSFKDAKSKQKLQTGNTQFCEVTNFEYRFTGFLKTISSDILRESIVSNCLKTFVVKETLSVPIPFWEKGSVMNDVASITKNFWWSVATISNFPKFCLILATSYCWIRAHIIKFWVQECLDDDRIFLHRLHTNCLVIWGKKFSRERSGQSVYLLNHLKHGLLPWNS